MSRIISLASGSIWRGSKSENRNDLIDYIKHLEIDGVELTFGSKEDLYAFKLSKDNEKWLRGLEYVTMHAPFDLIRKADNDEEVIKQLKIISTLYTKIKAKNVVIHPLDLPHPKILDKFTFKVSTENLPKKMHVSNSDLERIFKKYQKIGFCLDVCHAYSWSKYETRKLVMAFENKITQIHLSGAYRRKQHQSLKIVSKNFLYSINPVFRLSLPIIIEEDIEHMNKKFLEEEVAYIKKMFIN